jgi:hypothetical protein
MNYLAGEKVSVHKHTSKPGKGLSYPDLESFGLYRRGTAPYLYRCAPEQVNVKTLIRGKQ